MANNEHSFSDFEIVKISESRYLNPYRLNFIQNNHKRAWDGILSHSSVRQFRPVVYVNQVIESNVLDNMPTTSEQNTIGNLSWSKCDPKNAITYELCAGICDKNKSLEETVQEEILEECGFKVNLEDIHRVRAFRMGVGIFGAMHTIFYAEVNEKLRFSDGGGNHDEGEFIELFELHESKIKEFINDDSNPNPPGLLFALQWFLHDKDEHFANKNK